MAPSDPQVFAVHTVIQQDLTPAETFGKLVYINRRYVYTDEISDDGLPREHMNHLIEAVRSFRPDRDYLLIAGDHLQIVAMSALLARAYKQFRVLRFDREIGGYVPVLIDAR